MTEEEAGLYKRISDLLKRVGPQKEYADTKLVPSGKIYAVSGDNASFNQTQLTCWLTA